MRSRSDAWVVGESCAGLSADGLGVRLILVYTYHLYIYTISYRVVQSTSCTISGSSTGAANKSL